MKKDPHGRPVDSRDPSHETYENERLAALVRVMIDTRWTFRRLDLAIWRPTVRASGEITGVAGNVVILATDNNRGLFLRTSGEPFIGHIQCFTGPVRSLIRKPGKWDRASEDGPTSPVVKKKKQSKTKKQKAIDLWKEFIGDE